MSAALFAFAECVGPAEQLAAACGIPLHRVEVRHFPDGESLVRVPAAGPR